LAACNQQDGENDGDGAGASAGGVITRPNTDIDDVASAEPGTDRKQWDAADANTRAVTGNLTASVEGRGGPLMLAFATGVTVRAERDVRMQASDSIGVGPTNFSSVLNADPDAAVFLYRVTGEDVASVARQGGLCGDAKPTFLGISEYVGGDGEWVFKVAAFKGDAAPGPGATVDPVLCATYNYAMP
jgi:hypothetical protein